MAGRGEAGGGRGCEADSSPRVGSARRPMRATGFPAIVWKARTAGSSSMRSARPRDLSREDVCVSQHSIFSLLSPCFFQVVVLFLGICIGGIILNRQIDYFRRRIYGIN